MNSPSEIMSTHNIKRQCKYPCIENDCNISASFNIKGKRPQFCSKHKKEDMINVLHKLCQYDNCYTIPTYNFKGERNGILCKVHKEDNMINVTSKYCQKEGCNIIPTFNYEGKKVGIYCKEHKEDDMVCISIKNKCIIKNCRQISYFNLEGLCREYCIEHKTNEMINIVKCCVSPNCIKDAFFNEKQYNWGMYCNIHKTDTMINVLGYKYCIEINCNKKALYNYKNEKKAILCKDHKKDKMVNVHMPICIEQECNTIAIYNKEGEKYGLYCMKHKLNNMISISTHFCIEEGCKIRPTFNYEGEVNSIYCKTHKKENMIRLNKLLCKEDGCIITPIFNYDGEDKGLYCYNHKKQNMINVLNKHRECKTLFCNISSSKHYDGYCCRCFVHLFPERPNARNYKTKEKTVEDYIKQSFSQYDIVSDKKINEGCSKRRPDIYIDFGYQVIIIEIDEHQHRKYDCICENKRIMEISQDIGHRPLVIIRFNPDEYTTADEKVSSCWKYNKLGLCVVNRSKEKEWDARLKILGEQIKYWSENSTNKTVEIIHLLYDTL